MTLHDRLRNIGAPAKFSDTQVDGLLTGTQFVLQALKDDLEENEPEETAMIFHLGRMIQFLPLDMAAVKGVDRRRADATR